MLQKQQPSVWSIRCATILLNSGWIHERHITSWAIGRSLYFQIGHSWMTSMSQNRHFQLQYFLLIVFANTVNNSSQLRQFVGQPVKKNSSYKKIENNRKQEVRSVSNQPCHQPRPQMKVSKNILTFTSSSLKENKTRDRIK